jgi:tyrosyl-tRNA synthetase
VGSLLQIMILRHLQKAGHKPIVLMGGGTTKVGDPSGKDESRKLMTYDMIQDNIDSISQVGGTFSTGFRPSQLGDLQVDRSRLNGGTALGVKHVIVYA